MSGVEEMDRVTEWDWEGEGVTLCVEFSVWVGAAPVAVAGGEQVVVRVGMEGLGEGEG